MKIEAVTAKLYRIPPTIPWADATQRISGLEFLVTQVYTDTGLVGTGFTYTTGIGGSAIRALVEDYCAGMIIGEDPLAIERLWDQLNREMHRCGTGGINTLALASIDIALWDIAGQHRGEPLHQLLGAARGSIPAYGSGIDLHLDLDALLEEVRLFLEQGFDVVKIKVGRDDPAEDLARVTEVQRVIGPHGRLIVDGNQRWMVSEALPRLHQLAAVPLFWIEEPLHAENVSGHADLRRSLRFPLAVGESLYTKHQFLEYLSHEAVDIIQPDVCRVGGITEFVRIANLAAAYHRPVAPHFLAEVTVGVLCGIPNALILECVRGGSFSEMGVLQESLQLKNGVAYPFERPGHGIRFDFPRLAQYEVTSDQLRQLDLRST